MFMQLLTWFNFILLVVKLKFKKKQNNYKKQNAYSVKVTTH